MVEHKGSLVVGNWKMELSHKGQVEIAKTLRKLFLSRDLPGVQVVVCPSYPALPAVAAELQKSSRIVVGAQNVHWEEKGAWTGAVSVTQVKPFVSWSIVGHSEVRHRYGLSEEQVAGSVKLLLKYGVNPLVCVGETMAERSQDKTVEKVTQQIRSLMGVLGRTLLPKLAIAYEPIWAIGTGDRPEPGDVSGIVLLIRKVLAAQFGSEASGRVRVLYGGSVRPAAVADYVSEPGVDGVLVGGASVHPRDFVEVVEVVQAVSARK